MSKWTASQLIAITIKYLKNYVSQTKFVITTAYTNCYIYKIPPLLTTITWQLNMITKCLSVLWSFASPTRVPEVLQSVVRVGAEATEVAEQSVLESFITLGRSRAPLPAAADHMVPRPEKSHRRLLQTNPPLQFII